ncbi:MAG: hypothetical protein KBS41_02910, partial [Oscillospiraceae bacterium]|nr:hypothetical protein [Candidatus Equicaccousia limihippi]
YKRVGSVLITSNGKVDAKATVVSPDELKSVSSKYNWGILDINYDQNLDIESIIDTFYELAANIRRGGHIVAPERTYWHIPHGIEGVEVLCEAVGLTIEAPGVDDDGVLMITCN